MKPIIIQNKKYNRPLFVFAMKEEAANIFDDYSLVFTGLGKVNATYALTKAIMEQNPDIIINLGTAGSTAFNRGSVVCCPKFVQRDMDVTALGFDKFVTPFSNENTIFNYGLEMENLANGICGSGDSFETEHKNSEYNVIDMEGYALALVAKRENLPFLCLKYISDGADGGAANDWQEEIKNAAKKLYQALN